MIRPNFSEFLEKYRQYDKKRLFIPTLDSLVPSRFARSTRWHLPPVLAGALAGLVLIILTVQNRNLSNNRTVITIGPGIEHIAVPDQTRTPIRSVSFSRPAGKLYYQAGTGGEISIKI